MESEKKNTVVLYVDLSTDQYRRLKRVADENGFRTPNVLLSDIVHSYLNKNRRRLGKVALEFESKVSIPIEVSTKNYDALSHYSKATSISKTTFIHIILREILKKIKE